MTSASSRVSPVLESARITSSAPIMPRSPWLASVAWTNMATEPVEASVAAILRATWPDLPMPVSTTRPLASNKVSTARVKASSSPAASWPSASASAASTRRPTAMASKAAGAVTERLSLNRRERLGLQVAHRGALLAGAALGRGRLALHRRLHLGPPLIRFGAERLGRAVAIALRPDAGEGDSGDSDQGEDGKEQAVHAG